MAKRRHFNIDVLVLAFIMQLYYCSRPYYATGTTSEDRKSKSSDVTVNVERNFICAEYGEFLDIVCNLTAKDENETIPDSWSLSWSSIETAEFRGRNVTRRVRNNTVITSCLTVEVSWNDKKVFACIGSWSPPSGTRERWLTRNVSQSITVTIKPSRLTSITGKFLETEEGKKTLEASWKPIDSSPSPVEYTLRYCLEVDDEDSDEDDLGPVCPKYGEHRGECLLGLRGKPGATCRASVRYGLTAPTGIEHKLYVVSRRVGSRCETRSLARFTLQTLTLPVIDTDISAIRTLVLIPYPVINLRVMAIRYRTVLVAWSDPPFVSRTLDSRRYSLEYNCSAGNATIWEKEIISKTNTTLHSIDFHPYRPYALCEFCIKARISKESLFSEPVCAVTRLHEELPSGAPTITCSIGENECETIGDGSERRNVTITWILPPREDWNGALVKLEVMYRREGNRSIITTVPAGNFTAPQGATVLAGLDSHSSYVIQMVACNNVGCSHPSNATLISALPVSSGMRFSEKPLGTGAIVVVVFVGVMGVAIFLIWCRKRTTATKEQLPNLTEPENYENPGASESNEYNELQEEICFDILGSTEENGNTCTHTHA